MKHVLCTMDEQECLNDHRTHDAHLSLAFGIGDRRIVRQIVFVFVVRLVSKVLVTSQLRAVVMLLLVTFLSLRALLFMLHFVLVVPLLALCLLLVVQGVKRRRGLSPLGFLPNLRCYASPGAAQ